MDIEKVPEQVWVDLVKDNLPCQLEFLAASILLARLKLKVKQNPAAIKESAYELRNLFASTYHLPKVKKDLDNILNGKGY